MNNRIDSIFNKLNKKTFNNIVPTYNIPNKKISKSSVHKKIIVIDPLTLQPISSLKSPISKGNFMKFKVTPYPFDLKIKKITSLIKKKKSKSPQLPKLPLSLTKNSKLLKKPCKSGYKRNQITGRCNKIKVVRTIKVCPEGKILKKGRCVKTPENKLKDDKKREEKLWLKHQIQLLNNLKEIAKLKKDKKEFNLMKKLL